MLNVLISLNFNFITEHFIKLTEHFNNNS